MADPPVIVASNKYREQLARQDAQALTRLGETYARIYSRLNDKIELLIVQIGDEQPTQGQVVRLERYKALMQQTAEELQRFQGVLAEEILRSVDANIPLGELHARQLLSTSLVGNASIAGQFNVLPKSTIESILGFLSPDSPLYAKIQELAPFTADEVTRAIVEGVGLGYNPRKIAKQIENAYGQGLTNALRMTRTVQLYSYREASRASYIANEDVLEGWYWGARLDSSTCISCISQHGTLHPLTERLNDHHNGRCAMIPAVKGFPPPLSMQGEEWFNKQSEADKVRQMGKGMYEAYKAGKFSFSDISGTHKDEIYGDMRVARPLKDLAPAS